MQFRAVAGAHAKARLAVNGARPLREPVNSLLGGLTPAEYAELTAQIGANWLPGTHPVAVHYPATVGPLWGLRAPTGDDAIAMGQANLHEAITAASADGDPMVVVGLSMGTFVLDQEMAHLATAPDAPPPNQVTFVLFASPGRGVASLPPRGLRIPFFGYTTRSIPESQYNTSVVFSQYDFWGDFPDRPLNLVAAANAGMSFLTHEDRLHTPTAFAEPSRAVVVSRTTNARGGTTTTYMIPTPELPLTQPLRGLGVPAVWIDQLDKVLRPIVDAGYSRNDSGTLGVPSGVRGHLRSRVMAALRWLARRRRRVYAPAEISHVRAAAVDTRPIEGDCEIATEYDRHQTA